MRLNFIQLPPDVIITICTHIGPRDLLSFIQTCRVIHALGSTDYVWHQINTDLPLDTDCELLKLSGPEIKSSLIRVLKLDENWNKRVSRISRISKINPRNPVVDMQPLGKDWLVTSYRARGSSTTINISVWRLDTALPYDKSVGASSACVIAFEPARAFSFETAFREGEQSALISVLGASPAVPHKGQWTIYHLNLEGRRVIGNDYGEPYLVKQFLVDHSGVLYYSQISGPIVAAAVVHVTHSPCSHQILLLNTNTNVYLKFDSSEISNFDCGRMQFKIYPPYIVIVGSHFEKIKVYVRKMPSEIFSTKTLPPHSFDEDIIPLVKWEASIVEFETPRIRNLEISIPSEPIYPSSTLNSFTVMINHSPFSPFENGGVDIYRFPIDTTKRDLRFTDWKPVHTFTIPPNVSLEPICVGKTGRRAVWLSHQWNNDAYNLIKTSFPHEGDVSPHPLLVVDLQPPEMALPFEPRDCKAMYLEEATGRLFVGVHTGEIYILEFI